MVTPGDEDRQEHPTTGAQHLTTNDYLPGYLSGARRVSRGRRLYRGTEGSGAGAGAGDRGSSARAEGGVADAARGLGVHEGAMGGGGKPIDCGSRPAGGKS